MAKLTICTAAAINPGDLWRPDCQRWPRRLADRSAGGHHRELSARHGTRRHRP